MYKIIIVYLIISSILGAIGLFIVYKKKLWKDINLLDIFIAVTFGAILLGIVLPTPNLRPIIKIKKD